MPIFVHGVDTAHCSFLPDSVRAECLQAASVLFCVSLGLMEDSGRIFIKRPLRMPEEARQCGLGTIKLLIIDCVCSSMS